jgi:hypothetical protein
MELLYLFYTDYKEKLSAGMFVVSCSHTVCKFPKFVRKITFLAQVGKKLISLSTVYGLLHYFTTSPCLIKYT